MAVRVNQARRVILRQSHKSAHRLFDGPAPSAVGHIAGDQNVRALVNCRAGGIVFEDNRQFRQALIPHQHQEVGLGQVSRVVLVEPGPGQGESVGPIQGKCFAGR